MARSSRKGWVAAGFGAAVVLSGTLVFTQDPVDPKSKEVPDPASKTLPNPNPKVTKNWGALPDGRVWGNTAGVDIGPDGNVWAYDRCGTNSCLVPGEPGSGKTGTINPMNSIFKFDRNTGAMLAQIGGGKVIFPHGIHVDRDGNIWVTDGNDNAPTAARAGGAGAAGAGAGAATAAGGGGRGAGAAGAAAGGDAAGAAGRGAAAGAQAAAAGGQAAAGRALFTPNPAATMGHQVFKFSPTGQVLMTIGKPGGAIGNDCCYQPNDVITNAAGEIFIAEGHDTSTGRIRKFSKDGKLLKTFGTPGTGPGQLSCPHSLAFDSKGRLFVADRRNHRLSIYDQEGNLLENWYQFSRISGLFIDRNDNLYAIDSESNNGNHADWKTGVRIGKATEDRVLSFIPGHENMQPFLAAGEGVAVDPDGNVYGAEGPISRQAAGGGLTKYSK